MCDAGSGLQGLCCNHHTSGALCVCMEKWQGWGGERNAGQMAVGPGGGALQLWQCCRRLGDAVLIVHVI